MTGSYPYSQQKRDFLKLQFKFALKLKQQLDAGTITQEFYDKNIWLARQSLDSPYEGWLDEFTTAIESEDLQWLANQVGEDVSALAAYVGKTAGSIVGGLVGGATAGAAKTLGVAGWLFTALLVLVAIWAFTKGPLSKIKLSVL